MDIGSSGKWLGCALSNFAAHEFTIDGVRCASMEGFLQSLKHSNPEVQKEICTLVGIKAKRRGGDHWKRHQKLYWQGKAYVRTSEEYQQLLDRAYDVLFENEGFKAALWASGDAVFTHSVGKRKQGDTCLTIQEFCSRLTKLRDRLRQSVHPKFDLVGTKQEEP